MSDSSPLLVPVELDALIVNRRTRDAIDVERISMVYNTDASTSPEPAPFTNQEIWKYQKGVEGVYLHWILPQALRHGHHETEERRKGQVRQDGENPDDVTGDRTVFPLVPNRWLVVRYGGATDAPGSPPASRDVAAWVVESDAMYTQDRDATGAGYLDENGKAVTIGKKVPLDGWKESGNGFGALRAVAPGNHAFASYQPTNENVFSIHDPLQGVSESATLSYLVMGWYSNPDDDFVQTLNTLNALDEAGWKIEQPIPDDIDFTVPSQSVYHGLVHTIPWDAEGEAHTGVPSDLTLSVGSTSVEAFTALLQAQEERPEEGDALHPELIEALLLGMISETGTPQRIRNAAHELSFFTDKGGHAWAYRDATSPEETPSPAFLPLGGGEVEGLNDLNRAQAKYDAAVRTLRSLQHKLYALWWKQQRVEATRDVPSGWDKDKAQKELNWKNQDGLLRRVFEQMKTVASLQEGLPNAASGDETTPYQCVPRSAYWQTHDPFFLIAGAEASHIPAGFREVMCRIPAQMNGGLYFEKEDVLLCEEVMRRDLPLPKGLQNVPEVIYDLLLELFMVDPSNAGIIHSLVLGGKGTIEDVRDRIQWAQSEVRKEVDPFAFSLKPWTPPWTPLYVSWHVEVHPIPYVDADTKARQWTFDGTRCARLQRRTARRSRSGRAPTCLRRTNSPSNTSFRSTSRTGPPPTTSVRSRISPKPSTRGTSFPSQCAG